MRAVARTTAWTTALVDGALVGGWLAARELDDRPRARAAVRAVLGTTFAAQAFGGELAWQLAVGPDHPAVARDRRALQQALTVATVATGALSVVHRRLPAVLGRRGVERPHLVVGLAVALAYAAATLPVWRGEARRRLAVWEDPPLAGGCVDDEVD